MSEQNNQVSSVEDTVRRQQTENVRNSMNFVHESLVLNPIKQRLPENVFVAHFLPYFSGRDLGQGRNVIAEWIGVAGSPMSEVDIIDQMGQVIYSVPAIYDTNILEIVNRQVGHSFADIYTQYELRQAGIPVVAASYLNENLAMKSKEMIVGHIDDNSIAGRWRNIMARYGIQPAAGQAQQPSTTSSNLHHDDDVIYD